MHSRDGLSNYVCVSQTLRFLVPNDCDVAMSGFHIFKFSTRPEFLPYMIDCNSGLTKKSTAARFQAEI
jgi:hypothetical protein